MTYFADLAAKDGLDMTIANAGTEPAPIINPAVEAYLKNEGADASKQCCQKNIDMASF